MKLSRKHLLSSAPFALFWIGCVEDPAAPPANPPGWVLSVSAGVQPTFSWDPPEGQPTYLFVLRQPIGGGLSTAWAITGRFKSPVSYGTVPEGAVLASPLLEPTLEPGIRYRVEINAIVCDQFNNTCGGPSAARFFTP